MRTCWITLGAFGDICNTLPLVWQDFMVGNQPTMMVAKEYESILEGVGYCFERMTWPGHYSESARAADYVQGLNQFDAVYLCQCYGTNVERATDSFCKEAWRLVGKLDQWGKLPLVFDLRNDRRELSLFESIAPGVKPGVPVILLSYEGRSSPFPHKEALVQCMRKLEGDFTVVDISHLHGERFYDLLGLYDCATALVTTDTGTLHLANATPKLPVVALISDRPDHWHGSPAAPNHIARIRYGEFMQRIGEIPQAIRSIGTGARKLIHVFSEYDRRDKGAKKRYRVAGATWATEYAKGPWVRCAVHEKKMKRNGTDVGEMKPVPFVRDLFMVAVEQAGAQDIIVFSNDDTCFSPELTSTILHHVPRCGAMWGARHEHVQVDHPLRQEELVQGYRHCGADVFAFTREWWERHSHDFPDFLLTFEAWDLVLKKLILITGGVEVADTCYHEIHDSFWHVAENRECTGNLYNRELTREWLAKHQIDWATAFK